MGWVSSVRCHGSEIILCELKFQGVGWKGQPDMCSIPGGKNRMGGRKWYVPGM